MKQLDTYLGLCTEVYELSKPKPPADAYAFYRDYALKASGPILEPMCGTGRFLLPLLAEGFNVYGFDASDNMLNTLHAKAKEKNLEPTVWKGFVDDLKRPEKYNLIFIPKQVELIGSDIVIKQSEKFYNSKCDFPTERDILVKMMREDLKSISVNQYFLKNF